MSGKPPTSAPTLFDCLRNIALRLNIDPVQGWMWALEGTLSRELPDVQFAPNGLLPPMPGINPDKGEPVLTLDKMSPSAAAAWHRRIKVDLAFLHQHQNTGDNFGHVYRHVWVDPDALSDMFKRKLRATTTGKKPGPKPAHEEMRTALRRLLDSGQKYKTKKEAHNAVCKALGKSPDEPGFSYTTVSRACRDIFKQKKSAN